MSFIKILFSQIIYNFYTINVDPTNVDKVENWIIIFPLYRRNFESGWPTMTFNVCCFLITYSFLSYYSLEILSILNYWLDRFSSYGWVTLIPRNNENKQPTILFRQRKKIYTNSRNKTDEAKTPKYNLQLHKSKFLMFLLLKPYCITRSISLMIYLERNIAPLQQKVSFGFFRFGVFLPWTWGLNVNPCDTAQFCV